MKQQNLQHIFIVCILRIYIICIDVYNLLRGSIIQILQALSQQQQLPFLSIHYINMKFRVRSLLENEDRPSPTQHKLTTCQTNYNVVKITLAVLRNIRQQMANVGCMSPGQTVHYSSHCTSSAHCLLTAAVQSCPTSLRPPLRNRNTRLVK